MKLDVLYLTLYCGLIFYLSHQSTLPLPMAFPHQDKLVHGSAYAVMAWLAWQAFKHGKMPKLWLATVSMGFCSMYGVSDEFHQSFIQGRDADVWDWVADTMGAALMVSMIGLRSRIKEQK